MIFRRIAKTDVYRDLDLGRGKDTALATGLPAVEATGIYVATVSTVCLADKFESTVYSDPSAIEQRSPAQIPRRLRTVEYTCELDAIDGHRALVRELSRGQK